MISLQTWLRIREFLDDYFRQRALQAGSIRATKAGALFVDKEDIYASESYKVAARSSYFVQDEKYRRQVSREDVRIMRASLEVGAKGLWHCYVHRQFNGRMVLMIEPGVCEALKWQEGDKIAFRKLFSGELLTYIERKAKQFDER